MSNQVPVAVSPKLVESIFLKGKEGILHALPKFVNSERFMRVALTEIRNRPDLQKCDAISVCTSIMKAAQLGLDLDPQLGQAYLVPFFSKKTGAWMCNMITGYRGLVNLVRRSGEVSTLYAQCVYKGDHFKYELGTTPKIIHQPSADATSDMTHVYAVCVFKDSGVQFEVMSRHQVEVHRDRFSRQAQGDSWRDNFEEMAKKTVVRRLIKMLPITVDDGTDNERDAPVTVHNPEKFAQISAAADVPQEDDRAVYLRVIESQADELSAKGVPSEEIYKIIPQRFEELPIDQLAAITKILGEKLGS